MDNHSISKPEEQLAVVYICEEVKAGLAKGETQIGTSLLRFLLEFVNQYLDWGSYKMKGSLVWRLPCGRNIVSDDSNDR